MSGNGTTQRDARGRFTSESAQRRMVEAAEMIANATFARAELVRKFLDPRRDINDECGYPSTSQIHVQYYRELYDREPVANRVVQVLPRETWKVQPTVYESEDADNATPFELAWDELSKSLRGTSWYKSEESSPVWEWLSRVDELSGIGSYGLLLLGIDDGRELSEPADGLDEKGGRSVSPSGRRLLYLRAFDESSVSVVGYEEDQANPRYGQPTAYNVSFGDPSTVPVGQSTLAVQAKQVHWTRVIHVADNLDNSEVFGVPRMRPVFNRLYDLQKLYAGSAEMYWQGAFPGFSIETDASLAGAEIDAEAMRRQLEKMFNSIQRWVAPDSGMTVRSLAPQVVDPTAQIDTQIEAICIQLAVPKRIFTGSERGELASSQDARTWNGRLQRRQKTYVTPRLIVPFVDRLIALGVLPEPEEYCVVWPALETLSEQETADVAAKRTEALAKYVQGGVEAMVPPLDYLTRILGMTDEEAASVLEAAEERIAEEEAASDVISEPESPSTEEGTIPPQLEGEQDVDEEESTEAIAPR